MPYYFGNLERDPNLETYPYMYVHIYIYIYTHTYTCLGSPCCGQAVTEQRPTSRLMRRVFDITDEVQDNSQEDDNKNNSDGNDEELVVKMVHREVERQLRISPDDTKENIIAKVGDVGADTALMTCVPSYTLQSGGVSCAQDNTPCTVCNIVHVNMRMQKLRNSRQQQAAYKRISAQLKPLHPPIESTECWFLFEILGRIAPSVSPYLEGHTV